MEAAVVSLAIAALLSGAVRTLTPTISAPGFPSVSAMYLAMSHPTKLKVRNGRDVIKMKD
jgi:hypothetical protein